MSKGCINLAKGISPFTSYSTLLAFGSSKFYRETYLPKRLELLTSIVTKCEENEWNGVNEFWRNELHVQAKEMSSEFKRLRRNPSLLPHNPNCM